VSLGDLVARVLAFVRTGYPQEVPETDYFALLALLPRRLAWESPTFQSGEDGNQRAFQTG
jgi:hypothetical protein